MIQVGSIVKHFKYETLSDAEKAQNKYIYRIEDFAINTLDQSSMVVYRAMYGDFKLYVRPYSEFISEVDKEKYPNIKQRFRFEEIAK